MQDTAGSPRRVGWHGTRAALALLAGLAPLLAPPLAGAHNPKETGGLEAMATRAELIFRGGVEKVEYAFSTPQAKDERPIPHTFVTYRVDEVLKGAKPGKSLTLRFTGGRGKESDFLMVANYPLFDAGDDDVLFVRGNGFRACPLVGCAQGRFRAIDGMVYGERGNEVRSTKKGALYRGPQHDLEPVRTHQVSQTTISRVSVEEEGEDAKEAEARVYPGEHLSDAAFVDQVRKVVAATHTKEQLAGLRPVVSADPAKPFSFRMPPQVGPPDAKRPPVTAPPAAAAKEQESLAEGDDGVPAKASSR